RSPPRRGVRAAKRRKGNGVGHFEGCGSSFFSSFFFSSVVSSLTAPLKSRMAFPRPAPRSGTFFGPEISKALIPMIISSGSPSWPSMQSPCRPTLSQIFCAFLCVFGANSLGDLGDNVAAVYFQRLLLLAAH